jgi:hypothetical protein
MLGTGFDDACRGQSCSLKSLFSFFLGAVARITVPPNQLCVFRIFVKSQSTPAIKTPLSRAEQRHGQDVEFDAQTGQAAESQMGVEEACPAIAQM